MLDPAARASLPHTSRWYSTTSSQPDFAAVAGPAALADRAGEPKGLPDQAARAAAGKAASEKKKAERLAAAKCDHLPLPQRAAPRQLTAAVNSLTDFSSNFFPGSCH